ncbi:hypothetical protein ACFOUP_08800 [Belliella kenyensis]|uniref:Uncharacterized protein n=2 Tax=Belliella TaxID=232244 RepID=A0ABS9UYJ9_9BACT|nr:MULTISPECIES: hypothetical protein [Belliella]MCH7403427.1 hypothetical protein [Belliella kenyensis]MCH7409237.1 hypothetical protein [Belliella filtrata]MDN3601639.1 hypothetical protein [Belliella kenyensis]
MKQQQRSNTWNSYLIRGGEHLGRRLLSGMLAGAGLVGERIPFRCIIDSTMLLVFLEFGKSPGSMRPAY